MTIIVRSMYNFVNCLQFNIRYEKVERPAPMGGALVELSYRLVYTCLDRIFPIRPCHFKLIWPLGLVNYRHHFSSVVRRSTFHILIFSETTGLIANKLWQNGPWVAPFQNSVRWSQLPTKMAAKLKIEKRGGWNFFKIFSWNYWTNLDQTLLKWSLGGPFPNLCLAFQITDQDGRHSRT